MSRQPPDSAPLRRLAFAVLAATALGGAVLGAWSLVRAHGGGRPAALSFASHAELEALGAPDERARGSSAAGVGSSMPTTLDSAREREPALEPSVPSDAIWVSGRVVLPDAALPLDDELAVVASGARFPGAERRRTHRAPVSSDGTFRVAFAPGTRVGSLDLDARLAWLPQGACEVELAAGERVAELVAALGGRVLVCVSLPPGADPDELAGVIVTAVALPRDGEWWRTSRRVDEPDDAGVFEARALPAGHALSIAVSSATTTGAELTIPPLAPGETRSIAIALRRGARVSGRVVDEAGEPVQGASVELSCERDGEHAWERRADVDPHGAFVVRGIEPGDVRARATHAEYLDAEIELGVLADGVSREGVELRMRTGGVLRGTVRWPDGAPVVAARVDVETDQTYRSPGDRFEWSGRARASARTDEAGRFRIDRLETERADVKVVLDSASDLRASQEGPRRSPPRRGSAYVKDVLLSEREIELVLDPGATLRGRVLDDVGAPVRSFEIVLQDRRAGTDGIERAVHFARETVRDRAGRFYLQAVPTGEWAVLVEASGHARALVAGWTMPSEDELVITLHRLARVSGVVVDASGAAIPGASVHALPAAATAIVDAARSRSAVSVGTDFHGEFSIELAAGSYVLGASKAGRTVRAEHAIDVRAGESRQDVTLVLRRREASSDE